MLNNLRCYVTCICGSFRCLFQPVTFEPSSATPVKALRGAAVGVLTFRLRFRSVVEQRCLMCVWLLASVAFARVYLVFGGAFVFLSWHGLLSLSGALIAAVG